MQPGPQTPRQPGGKADYPCTLRKNRLIYDFDSYIGEPSTSFSLLSAISAASVCKFRGDGLKPTGVPSAAYFRSEARRGVRANLVRDRKKVAAEGRSAGRREDEEAYFREFSSTGRYINTE
ncbi:hypothetical protein KM043_006663 [Ampulex compressa]|nr:hypothetical protein KM043_006663 [Ampulex compressa]